MSKRPPPHATARIAAERRTAAEELIATLLVASPILLKGLTADERAEHRRVIDFAKRNALVPAGHYIEMKQKDFNLLQITLRDVQHPNSRQVVLAMPCVRMPTELRSLHPVVAALEKDRGRLNMPETIRRRSLLFLHGLTREAVHRGYQVREQPVPERYRYQYWSGDHPGHRTYFRRDGELNIVIDDCAYTVSITQESPESDVPGRYERLVVSLAAHQSQGRQYRWYDRKRVTIDDRIAVVLHELEARAEEEKQRQIYAERQKAERKRQWEAAMERARQLAVQAYFANHLDVQVGAWQQAHDIRAYCDALEQKIGGSESNIDTAQAAQWLDWARRYAAAIDPLASLPAMPPAPELQGSDLEPYLDGWSPHGPEQPEHWRR